MGASGSDAEKTLASADLAGPLAGPADFWRRVRFAAATLTRLTGFQFFYVDLFIDAGSGIHKADGQIVSQVRASSGRCSGTSASKAEKVVEDIAETGEDIFEPSKSGKTRSLKTFVTEFVVYTSFICISEDFIGLSSFFETFLRLLIALIAVRVIFQRQFSVTGFDFIFIGLSAYSQYLVVIPFSCHGPDLYLRT
jgi:hypothetical protein